MSYLRNGSSYFHVQGFPGASDGKKFTCNPGERGEAGLIPGSGTSPGEGTGNPLQYSCLGNTMARESGRLQSMESQRVRHDGEGEDGVKLKWFNLIKVFN